LLLYQNPGFLKKQARTAQTPLRGAGVTALSDKLIDLFYI
jgi:hypothetical protein